MKEKTHRHALLSSLLCGLTPLVILTFVFSNNIAARRSGKGDGHGGGESSNVAVTANSTGSILSTGAVLGWKHHLRDRNRREGAWRRGAKLRDRCEGLMRRDGFWIVVRG